MRVFQLLHKAHQAAFRSADHRLRGAEGVSTAQLAVLLVLSQEDGLPMSQLAQRTGQPMSSLSGLVDRMVAKGFLYRSAGEADARVQLVFLQASGRDSAERVRPYVAEVNEVLLAPFSLSERETIERFLLHVVDSADSLK